MAPLQVPWGSLLHFQLGSLDLPAFGAPGEAFGVFNNNVGVPTQSGPLKVIAGDSFVLAVDMANPSGAMAIKPYGNATQPGSAHVTDQLALYASRALRPVWRTPEDVERHLELRELFR